MTIRRAEIVNPITDSVQVSITGPIVEVMEANLAFQDLTAIVRELAEGGPFIDVDTFADATGDACSDCHVRDGDLYDPTNHEPSCLWRRARALYPGVGG